MSGSVRRTVSGLDRPMDVMECDGGAAYLVTAHSGHTIVKVSRADGGVVESYGGVTQPELLLYPTTLALLPERRVGGTGR